MITHTSFPLNAEPESTSLIHNDVTPTPLLFHRNHGPVPSDARTAFERNRALAWDVVFQLDHGVVPEQQRLEMVVTVARLKQYETVHEDIALQVWIMLFRSRNGLFTHFCPSSVQETGETYLLILNNRRLKASLGRKALLPISFGRDVSFARCCSTCSPLWRTRRATRTGMSYLRVAKTVEKTKVASLAGVSLEGLPCELSCSLSQRRGHVVSESTARK